MNQKEQAIKNMLESGKKIFEERGLTEELELYCHFYVESGAKPQSILFLAMFPDKSGWIALTEEHVTIIQEETRFFSSKLLPEVKIPYENIVSFNCKKHTLEFTDGNKYKMQFYPEYQHFYDRIIEKFIEKGVSVIR